MCTSSLICLGATLLSFFADWSWLHPRGTGTLDAFFQILSAHTTVGLNSIDLNTMSRASLLIILVVMAIGASPAGTGGGIKTTSVTALWAILQSVTKSRSHVTFLSVRIPKKNQFLALSSFISYGAILLGAIFCLFVSQDVKLSGFSILFEAVSALSTVGLSLGATSTLDDFGLLMISVLMFMGRLGVLSFALALLKPSSEELASPETETVAM